MKTTAPSSTEAATPFTNQMRSKAEALGFPNSNLRVVIEFTHRSDYILRGITDRGVLIGPHAHLQLIDWAFVKNVY